MKKKKLTLEIGSGNNPRSGADILVDRYLFDNSQRAGAYKAVVDRPFVIGDGYRLPFKDKSFDYVYCSHVLEHTKDPLSFVKELMRVGKKGYIEVPGILSERLFGWDFHLWYCEKTKNGIVLTSKKEGEKFEGFFHRLIAKNTSMRRFFEKYENMFYIHYTWNNHINLKVNRKEKTAVELRKIDAKLWSQMKKMDWEILDDLKFEIAFLLKRVVRKFQKIKRNSLWDIHTFISPHYVQKILASLLICPVCGNDFLYFDVDTYLCVRCKEVFPILNNIPVLLSKAERKKGY